MPSYDGLYAVTVFLYDRKPDHAALPLDSQYPFPAVPQSSSECHSCLWFQLVTRTRYAHNPKVEGSNPSPATNSQVLFSLTISC
jgi:hypothetical protein